jgi:TolB-like protein/cytochrome c-type biogenesis protein CcmH/NrfG
MERRLAAILAADVVGFSRMMESDEAGTLALLKTRRKEVLEPLVARHRGRIFKVTGDGVLIEFASAVNAVQCAIDLQQAMSAANVDQSEDRHVVLRIGVNLGDVIVEGSDLYGEGINIAARLESIAEPGGITVSGSAFDQVKNKIDVVLEDLGPQNMKNIAEAVRVYRVTETPRVFVAAPPAQSSKPSIAVLPFANLSDDPEQEYFADGMVEDIITALSHFKELFVIARNSSFVYKGRSVDISQIAKELGVRYVLEGSVRKSGNRVRITGQLIDAATQAHLWADRFDGTQEDIFDLQDKLTEKVVGIVEPQIRKAEMGRSRRKRPWNLDAYDLYLRALPHLYSMQANDNSQALEFLTQAIRLDPNFAPALAFAAWCYEQRLTRSWNTVCADDLNNALRLARAALATGSDNANAVGMAGFVLLMIGHEYEVGLSAIRRATELNPNNALILSHAGFAYCMAGDLQEAIACFRRARRLSPVDPGAFFFLTGEAKALLFSSRYTDAVELARRSAATYDRWDSTYWYLAAAYGHLGQTDEANKAIAKILALSPSVTVSRMRKLPIRDKKRLDILLDGLRKAGLPE